MDRWVRACILEDRFLHCFSLILLISSINLVYLFIPVFVIELFTVALFTLSLGLKFIFSVIFLVDFCLHPPQFFLIHPLNP